MGEVARTVAPAVKTPKKDLLVVAVDDVANDNEEDGGGGGAQERTAEVPNKSADITRSVVDILMVFSLSLLLVI